MADWSAAVPRACASASTFWRRMSSARRYCPCAWQERPEVASGEGLQRQILGRVGDAQAALAVVDGEVRLAVQVVIVDEVAVHARQARLVAQLGAELLGLLRELEDLAQPPQLEQRRAELEPDVDRLLELGCAPPACG